MMKLSGRALACWMALPLFGMVASDKVTIADEGRAKMPIVVGAQASETTRNNAAVLADYLKKITGADFAIEEGDGSKGIAIGREGDFSALPKKLGIDPQDIRHRDDYLLHTHKNGLLLIGAWDLGAQNAMWDFLGRQGYRQYFPGPVWEIIPRKNRIEVSYDEIQEPDYLMRTVWYSGGMYPERAKLLSDWRRKNRMESGVYINAGHMYEGLLKRHKAEFEAHPEYLAMVNGERKYTGGAKLNIANADLRNLVIGAMLERFRKDPDLLSVSVDPSDGGGWDEGEEAKAIGSPSNQAIFLANEVAEAVDKEFPGRFVGLYAYNYHSDPPTIKIHPNVVVLVATWFRKTPLSLKDQIEGWARQGATVGIRDYLSYPAMDYDLPSRARGAEIRGFAKRFRDYYAWGARYYSGEAADNWGINGLLYYASSRLLWDVNDTGFIDGLQEEFISDCFGPVADLVRPYYAALQPRGAPILGEDLIHRLYASIAAAKAKNTDPAIAERLDDLAMYTRYLELHYRYSEKGDRQAAALEMFRHLYRTRFRSVDHSRGVIRDIAGRNKALTFTVDERKQLRAGVAPGGNPEPYTREEIDRMIAEGLKNNTAFDFETKGYSKDLVPAGALFGGSTATLDGFGPPDRSVSVYTWAEEAPCKWTLRIANNGAAPGVMILNLWAREEAFDEPVDHKEVIIEPGEIKEVELRSPHAGLHWVSAASRLRGALQILPDPDRPLDGFRRHGRARVGPGWLYGHDKRVLLRSQGKQGGRGASARPGSHCQSGGGNRCHTGEWRGQGGCPIRPGRKIMAVAKLAGRKLPPAYRPSLFRAISLTAPSSKRSSGCRFHQFIDG